MTRLLFAVRALEYGAVIAAAAVAGYFWGPRVSLATYAALFTGLAVLAGALVAISAAVFGKLDKALEYADGLEIAKTTRLYGRLSAARARLVAWMFSGVIGIATMVAISTLLKDAPADANRLLAVAFGALALIVLCLARVAWTYVRLDKFRLDLVTLKENERRRSDTLQQMRTEGVLGRFSDDAPAHVGSLPTR